MHNILAFKSSYFNKINILFYIQLHLFLDQLSHCSVEFTAYDIFTLNIRLITSVSLIFMCFTIYILIDFDRNKLLLCNIN